MRLLTFIIFVLNISTTFSQSLSWAKKIGGTSNDMGVDLVLDNNKNVYSVGRYIGTVDFDPGSPIFNFNGLSNQYNPYISKLDSNGNFVWAKTFVGSSSGTNISSVFSIDIDKNNNIYIVGNFLGTVDFDPGAGVFNLSASSNGGAFICKLNSNGNFVWVKSFDVASSSPGIVTGNIFPMSVKIDTNNNVLITGNFGGTVDFNPSVTATYNLTGTYSNAVMHNIFISKLDVNGNFIWAKKISSNKDIRVYSMALDGNNRPIFSGWFNGVVDFDPGTLAYSLTSSNNGFWQDGFWCKLDANGNFLWTKKTTYSSTSSSANIWPKSITVDVSGNILSTGYFGGTVDFDPGTGTFNLSSTNNGGDVFILKFNSNGNFVWVKKIGGIYDDEGSAIVSDINSNIYITGYFKNTVDFDPGTSSYNMTSSGNNSNDQFICKLNSNGLFSWAVKIGGIGTEQPYSIKVDVNNNIYTTGFFQDNVDFDPGPSTLNLSSSGSSDIFISKYGNCIPKYGVDFRNACNLFTWINGVTYNTSNNIATHTIPGGASNGCDSIVTLNLNLNNSTYGIDVKNECNSFRWIDGNTYFSNNNTATYTILGGASNGCDSIVTLNLTINRVSDLTTIVTGTSITSNNAIASYQWLDCDNNFAPIVGENNQIFNATGNGNFAVELTEGSCKDTSLCVNVTTVNLMEIEDLDIITLHPNPNFGNFQIDLGDYFNSIDFKIYDSKGILVQSKKFEQIRYINHETNLSAGVYNIHIKTESKNKTIKLIIKS